MRNAKVPNGAWSKLAEKLDNRADARRKRTSELVFIFWVLFMGVMTTLR